MELYSTNGNAPITSFKQALFTALAPDGGLYMPKAIRPMPSSFFQQIDKLNFVEISTAVATHLLGDEIEAELLHKICHDAFDFDLPLVEVENDSFVLELFHGPSAAFKDFGARFMARLLSHYLELEQKELTILVATSGDTGGAVAAGFHKVPNTKVVILYPSDGVSDIQERQLNSLGDNISVYKVNGSFDDCQALVKQAFNTHEITDKHNLSSANSINIGRLIPQIFYYFRAWAMLPKRQKHLIFSVPSGNFGNACAGLFATQLGLPIDIIVGATNANLTVPNYKTTHKFVPRPTVKTISNAMDVGNPSNFARILALFNHDPIVLTQHLYAVGFNDAETIATIEEIWRKTGYILEPHTAVGYLGSLDYRRRYNNSMTSIVLGTAHPGKFADVMPEHIAEHISWPPVLDKLRQQPCTPTPLENSIEALTAVLNK